MSLSVRALLALSVVGALYVVLSSQELPSSVASHFGAGGMPDSFTPRAGYMVFMAGLTLGLPLLIPLALKMASRLPPALINLPNRDYWLAPERKGATFQYLVGMGAAFGFLLLVLLCFVHWQVVQANSVQPPRLAEGRFLGALVLFVACTLGWLGAFVAHFYRTGR